MEHLDIIIYAVIAAVLLARLWVVFGRRNDEDGQRPNPFATPAPRADDDESSTVLPGRDRTGDAPKSTFAPLKLAPASLEGGLEQVRQLDPSFDEKQFLQTVRASFKTIVEDFAKGDLARSAQLLDEPVRRSFEQAISARRDAGQTLEGRVARIADAEVTAARVEGPRALITVRFASEQENVLRDAGGEVIAGAPGQSEEIADLWVFARDPKSSNPNWILAETRS